MAYYFTFIIRLIKILHINIRKRAARGSGTHDNNTTGSQVRRLELRYHLVVCLGLAGWLTLFTTSG